MTSTTGACPSESVLFAALEGELPRAEGERWLRHLARCAACGERARRIGELQRLEQELRALGRSASSADATVSAARNGAQARPPAAEVAIPRPPRVAGLEAIRPIGSGGCAEVWLARGEAGDVALKVAHAAVGDVEFEALRLYKRCADDPLLGLLPVHHVTRCEESGRLCYTMPLADPLHGRSLRAEDYEPATLQALLEASGGLPVDEVLALAAEVLRSLGRLHARGLVHRDVKPSNLVRWHGRWTLADSGLLVREGRALAGTPAGTPGFLPPEGRNDQRQADLFALGKTLYAASSGGLEGFPVPSAVSLAQRSVAARRLHAAVLQACEPLPERRFPDAAAMARALRGAPLVVRRALALGLAGLLLVAGALALFRADPLVHVAEAATAVEWEVARLRPEFGTDRFVRSVWNARSIPPGNSLVVWAEEARFRHVGLVLATYVGDERSVQAVAPVTEPGSAALRFAVETERDWKGYALVTPAPLLGILFGADEPWDPERIEELVERAMDAAGGWPRVRSAEVAGPPAPGPRAFHGTRIEWLHVLRGGPELPVGERVEDPLARLLRALRPSLPAFDGFLVEVRS